MHADRRNESLIGRPYAWLRIPSTESVANKGPTHKRSNGEGLKPGAIDAIAEPLPIKVELKRKSQDMSLL